MFPARIQEYLRPRSVAEALAAITRYDAGDAIFLAGGQSAMQAIKSRMLRPQCVVDLQGIAELKGVSVSNGALTIGAMTRYVEIAGHGQLDGAFAALRDATSHVGDRQVRNRGTIGGSVCWNYVAACTPTVVLALAGAMNLAAADGSQRSVAADDFFLGPLETARRDDEILLSVSWPAPPPRTGSAYKKWGLVTDALPVIGVAVTVTLDAAGQCSAARIALAGLADGAQRGKLGEAKLVGSRGETAAIDAAMGAIADAADAHSDMSADADYRKQLIRSLGREVATRAFDRARG
ncbi:MAG: FAD binding domain-containing protein [Gammaproteobacteria bacterium]|nr:FAD binding domain-containing protein [Gammaproteobacteria bacterium]